MSNIVELNSTTTSDLVKVNNISLGDIININGISSSFDWAGFTGDDFTGTDGDLPNAAIWVQAETANKDATIQSNKLNFVGTSGEKCNNLGKFNLSGDFDVQVDFSDLSIGTPSSATLYAAQMLVYEASTDTHLGQISRARTYLGVNNIISLGEVIAADFFASSETEGKLRMTRVSGVIKVWHWHAGNARWEYDGGTEGWTVHAGNTNNVYITLNFNCGTGGTLTANMDNFTINSGTVVPPYDWAGFTGDDFTGVDGTDPNPIVWTLTQNDGGYASIVSNDWHYDSGGGDNNYQTVLKSRFTLSGDFQIKVSFANLVWDAPTDAGCYFPIFQLFTSAPAEVARISRLYTSGGTDGFSSQGNAAGSETYAEAGSSGVLRLIRTSDSITCSQWDAVAERWEWNGAAGTRYIGNSSANLSIQLFLEQENNSQVVGDILGVEIVSGTVVPP